MKASSSNVEPSWSKVEFIPPTRHPRAIIGLEHFHEISMSAELELIPVLIGDRTDYKLNGIPEAGVSDVYRSRDRTVYQTVPCAKCDEYKIPCWRPLSVQRKKFLRCILCERHLFSCDDLEMLHSNIIVPPTPYRTYILDIAPAVEKHQGDSSITLESALDRSPSVSAGTATPPVDGSSPSVRLSGPLKLFFSTKRSLDALNPSDSSPKRPRTADGSDVTQPTSPDERFMAEAQAKTLATSKRDGFDDYQIDGFPHIGYGEFDAIRGKVVYETTKCQQCRAAKRRNCWRTIASADTFAHCTRCIKKGLMECDTPRITSKTLIQPGMAYTGSKRMSKAFRETTSAGLDKHLPRASRPSPASLQAAKSSAPAIKKARKSIHETPSRPPTASGYFSSPLDLVPPKISRVLRSDEGNDTATGTLLSAPPQDVIPLSPVNPNDWWKGGLSLPDDLLIQQLSELKKAKTLEAEARLERASEAYDTQYKALAKEKEGMETRLEAMRKVVEALERDVDAVTIQIASNEAEFEQRKAECEAAKTRYSLL